MCLGFRQSKHFLPRGLIFFSLNEGHYLSASAQMWASTHSDDLREKMSSVVSVLEDCQNKIGTGYLSAFPSELFDRFESLQEVWAPYYTIHKVQASNSVWII